MSGDLDTFFCGQMRWGGKYRHLGALDRQIVVVDLFFCLSQTHNDSFCQCQCKTFLFRLIFHSLSLTNSASWAPHAPTATTSYRFHQISRSQAVSLKNTTKNLGIGKKVNTVFWRQKPLLLTVWLLAGLASAWGFQCPQSALCCLIKHDYWIRNMKIWQRQLSLLGMKGPVIWWWRWCWHSFRRNQFCNKQLFSPSILSPVFCPQYFAPSEVSYLQYFFL